MKKLWIIKDWAGNRLYPDQAWNDFEAAWCFIYENFEEEDYQELSVLEEQQA